jgi:oligopeptide/dipeptide ABC transporter ATP-binding protein
MNKEDVILDIRHLRTSFYTDNGELRAVDDLSYQVHAGECVAIVGESGSGKSVSALSVMRLVSFPPGLILGGEIFFNGQDLLKLTDAQMQQIRGSKISMIFQEPTTSLNPVMTIGDQIAENIMIHKKVNKAEAMEMAIHQLKLVEIPNPEQRAKQYPFEFSGGMQQRAMIAMAMSCGPELLIADEPTTALDVTVQAQVLDQLNNLRQQFGSALIIITHNLGVVARYADSVKVMYGGKIVEDGPTEEIFRNPHHPYTLGLIKAVPRLDLPRSYGLHTIEGDPPDMTKVPPESCAFAPRCPFATEECFTQRPKDEVVGENHTCACFHKDELVAERDAKKEAESL